MTSFELVDSIHITPEEDWASCVRTYKTVKLTSDLEHESLTGNDRSGARHCKGVYRWIHNDQIIYVGKAARKNNIAARQDAHLASFRNTESTAESSGKKLRGFLENNKVNQMILTIEYIDMSHCKDSTVSAFEDACIKFWNPLLNFGD
jgi:hypothetical protein